MREFKGVEGWIRRHFFIYTSVRRAAPFLCKFMTLEDGFDVLSRVVPSDGNFIAIDIGANDGTSIRMIRQYLPKASIVAFDPVTKPKFKLKSVEFVSCALGDVAGELEIFTPEINGYKLSQYSSFHREKLLHQLTHDLGVAQENVTLYSRSVEVLTLDSKRLAPFFIKLDVEGAELVVLKGARETIKSHLPLILVEIQNRETFLEIAKFLNQYGYSAIAVSPKKNLTMTDYMNNELKAFDPRFNNYVWVSDKPTSSWRFKA